MSNPRSPLLSTPPTSDELPFESSTLDDFTILYQYGRGELSLSCTLCDVLSSGYCILIVLTCVISRSAARSGSPSLSIRACSTWRRGKPMSTSLPTRTCPGDSDSMRQGQGASSAPEANTPFIRHDTWNNFWCSSHPFVTCQMSSAKRWWSLTRFDKFDKG